MEKKLSIVIPYRNREEHLKIFLKIIKRKINVSNYDILIVEQDNKKPFNRAKLLNIGFDLKKDESDYFCFHDADMMPEEADYSYVEQPTHGFHAIKHLGYRLSANSNYGGVNYFNKEDFIKINGYSNEFWEVKTTIFYLESNQKDFHFIEDWVSMIIYYTKELQNTHQNIKKMWKELQHHMIMIWKD